MDLSKDELLYRTGAILTNSSAILNELYKIKSQLSFSEITEEEKLDFLSVFKYIENRVNDIKTHSNELREPK